MGRLLNYRNPGRAWPVWGRSVVKYSTVRKLINALRTEVAYRSRRSYVRSYPYVLLVEPLYYCNLACPLCDRQVFPDARRDDAGKLSMDLFTRILDECGAYLYQCGIFGQGEPLLDWPRTREIIAQAHARRIFTFLSTNSTLVTPTVAGEVVASGLDYLVCAIDGVSQEGYSKYRVGGRVDDALQGLARFAEEKRRQRAGLTIEWQFLVHRYNHHEIGHARRIARDIGVVLRLAPLRGMEFDAGLQAHWLPEADDFQDGRKPVGQTVNPWPCYFLWRSLVLNSNGKAARCLIYQNVAEYASAAGRTVHELYNDPSVQRARELFARGPVAAGPFPAPCNNCGFFARHHGGPNLDKHQSLGRPSPNDVVVPLVVRARRRNPEWAPAPAAAAPDAVARGIQKAGDNASSGRSNP